MNNYEMSGKQFEEFVYPTIGKLGSAKHLQERILEILNKDYLIDGKLAKINFVDFYCYVSQYVFEDWRLNNLRMSEYYVDFQFKSGSVYLVKLKTY